MPILLADYALGVTLVQLFIWVVLFPVLVQGLIVYAVVLARGEKRENDMSRNQRARRRCRRVLARGEALGDDVRLAQLEQAQAVAARPRHGEARAHAVRLRHLGVAAQQ